ncbi:lipid II:glycine glycyltransferase FemX [Salibacterium halotolerans]|uniref:Lipid II:glycine glycyltransferase n=1 Tax=Salibacterium halotolerans TaxID=1884432 RepID=A0A1I5XVK1_9BACI|nr:GNAT family N-acetyltransferase [Salibacterium halotolerans]SFQ35978.1 Acetyltransferase (GNAT) domain-containing protein [Salibacterium halotolerans]
MLKIIKSSEEWKEILTNFHHIDVYYTFEYGALFAEVEQGELQGAFFEYKDCRLFYSYIIREIPDTDSKFYDIVTPYGYGGPYVEGNSKEECVEQFYEHFSEYCRENNIVSEIIRFHPLLNNVQYCAASVNTRYIRKTTGLDLSNSYEVIKTNYSSMSRRNVRKAERQGLYCRVVEKTPENIHTFMQMYHETMDRNHASSYYYFDYDFFKKQLKDSVFHSNELIFAFSEETVIGAVILMMGRDYSHYHLGCSSTSYLKLRPNNILFDYMISRSKDKNLTYLHLGGGYSEDDGLFRFKTSFTNNEVFDYYLGTNVFNEEKYNDLVHYMKSQYTLDENFFPQYRGVVKY